MSGSANSRPDAKQWIRSRDPSIRIIAAEMIENAGRVNLLWNQAIAHLESEPADALTRLVDIEILLESHIRIERRDLLAAVRQGAERLANALPDER